MKIIFIFYWKQAKSQAVQENDKEFWDCLHIEALLLVGETMSQGGQSTPLHWDFLGNIKLMSSTFSFRSALSYNLQEFYK